ncbi:MAG: Peptidase C60 sortase A and B [Candidatus Yanofskybacteria bacterium GW2011_GWD2_39_48]|uniref:Peptidase C60 sortase A and B n=1 Tax=Candidatus Yanofskybacteria bacterium GW2011_GWD2_39_48 TaxID=1619031 RepID=A0A0G0P6C3_9BACT|nr:MAG: Peptidase C60 sortase A and B [Candidatus Yanofskybacteria bacterium GW2011_GWD2_39_48]
MKSKDLLRKGLLAISLTAYLIALVLIFYFIPKSLARADLELIIKNAIVYVKQGQVNYGLPVRLRMPSIDTDAIVEHLGITPDGIMDTPKNIDNVAWFNLGPRPGEIGSAVIAGHYGWKNGKASIFINLYKLKKGDKLYVEDDKGVAISFIVRETRKYDQKADASGVFSSSDGRSRLNLITCEGDWDKVSKSYPERLVVFTEKE